MSDRRHRFDRQTEQERGILELVGEIEALGADPRLTAAQQALEVAFNCIADWQDDQPVPLLPLFDPEPAQPLKVVPLLTVEKAGAIKTLENFLKIARTDGLTGVGIVAVDLAGNTHSAYEQGHNIALLLGAIKVLESRLVRHYQGI